MSDPLDLDHLETELNHRNSEGLSPPTALALVARVRELEIQNAALEHANIDCYADGHAAGVRAAQPASSERVVLAVIRELGPATLSDCYGLIEDPEPGDPPLDVAVANLYADDRRRAAL